MRLYKAKYKSTGSVSTHKGNLLIRANSVFAARIKGIKHMNKLNPSFNNEIEELKRVEVIT